jgi:predicted TIM-barrel fold metal-dependent hydrolase
MKGRPIDMHVHLTTPGFFRTLGPFIDKVKAYFRAEFGEIAIEQALREYGEAGVGRLVLLPIDASRLTGMPGDTNDQMAELQRVDPERVIAFATVDPLAGRRAVMELERAVKDLGLKGLKLHPQLQRFRPDDERCFEVYQAAEDLGIPALFHTGTSGIGAGMEGGGGIRLDHGRPIYIDNVAAEFPRLKLIMAHFGWPWYEEALAIAQQKANVYIELSGWSPRYIPQVVWRYADNLIQDKVLFGSDYPMIRPARWLADFEKVELKPETREKILWANAERVLGIR